MRLRMFGRMFNCRLLPKKSQRNGGKKPPRHENDRRLRLTSMIKTHTYLPRKRRAKLIQLSFDFEVKEELKQAYQGLRRGEAPDEICPGWESLRLPSMPDPADNVFSPE